MPTLKEVEFYLRGLWLLFKQDPSGFSYLDLTDRGAVRSFWAILWALPAILISFAWWRLLYLQGLPEDTGPGAVFFFRLALVEASPHGGAELELARAALAEAAGEPAMVDAAAAIANSPCRSPTRTACWFS